jgi:hypothetical protein
MSSKLAALGALAGRAGGAAASAGGAVSGAVGSAGTAVTQTATYQGAAANAAKSVGLEINYGQIGIIMFFGLFYLVIASLGIDMFNKCPDQQGNKTQENLKNFLSYTLAISLTIPCTLFLLKVAGSKLSGIMVLLFGIMGVVGSSAALNWSRTCESAKKDDSKKAFSAVSLVVFLLAFLVGLFMLKPSSVPKAKAA